MALSLLDTHADITINEIPTLWLLGKPDSGKKSIVEALTSYENTPSTKGFTSCGSKTKSFDFPSDISPIMRIMVTTGIEDSLQGLMEEVPACHSQTHIIVVTARIMDLDQAHIYETAGFLRQIIPQRPLLLALTCLHEAYDGYNHPDPYPFTGPPPWCAHDPRLKRLNLASLKHWSLMKHPASRTVLIDITPSHYHYSPAFYGADALFENIVDLLPGYARKLLVAWMNGESIASTYVIQRYSCLAALAGNVPFSGDEALEVMLVQESMVNTLSRLLKFPYLDNEFMEIAGQLMKSTASNWPATRLFSVLPDFLSIKPPIQGHSIHCVATAALGLLYLWYTRHVLSGRHPSWEIIHLEYRKKIRTVLDKWPSEFRSLLAGFTATSF